MIRKIFKREEKCMAYVLASGMQVGCQIQYTDAAGNPAKIDGDVAWSSSDETKLAIFVSSTDSTQVVLRAIGLAGMVQISAVADADLGAGVRELTTLADVEVVAGEAVAGTISPTGSPEPIPPT
jgi:hypothetical protein